MQVLPCRSQVLERLQAIFEAFGAVVPGVTNRLVLPLDGLIEAALRFRFASCVRMCPAEWQRYQGMSRETRIVCIWRLQTKG